MHIALFVIKATEITLRAEATRHFYFSTDKKTSVQNRRGINRGGMGGGWSRAPAGDDEKFKFLTCTSYTRHSLTY